MIDEKKLIKDIRKLCSGHSHILKHVCSVINSQPKISEWIPCSERLPETEECYVLCDIFDDEEDRHIIKIMRYENFGNCEYEFCNSFGLPQNVIAWKPLPEPYKTKE